MAKLSDFQKHDITPFDVDFQKRNKSVTSKKIGGVYNQFTGELISENVSIVVQKAVDKSEFVKVFSENIALFFEISECEIKVFFYLMLNLHMNKGKSFFDLNSCMQITGYTKSWIYKALANLLEKQFIARSTHTNYYWINHGIAFNGSRLTINKHDED